MPAALALPLLVVSSLLLLPVVAEGGYTCKFYPRGDRITGVSFADPTIHGRMTCMLTNATTFKSKEPRNVTGGSCAGGQCTRNACASSSCSRSVAAERVPSEDFVQDPIVHAFIEFIYLTVQYLEKLQ